MNKYLMAGLALVVGFFIGSSFHYVPTNSMSTVLCKRPGSYILSQDDTTITSCHDYQPQIWQKSMTVVVEEEKVNAD